MSIKKVVILGAGFAGLNAAKILGNSPNEVCVIDKTNHHLFQPLLYQVATAALAPSEIAVPIREILSPYSNVSVILGEVTSVDKDKKTITLKNGDELSYEYLIVSLGARHSYFGHDEWEKLAPGLKNLSDALKIRETILTSFEIAERSDSIAEREKYLTFVVIGGGPTGVEMAGAIAEVAFETMVKNFRNIDTSKTKIYLVEGSHHLLAAYPEDLSHKAKKYLENLGVTVLSGQRVSSITEEGVQVDGQFITTKNVVWAAGNQASPILKSLNTPLDKQGRALVDPDLSLPDHPEIFILGDAACVKDKNGNPLPGLAPVAVQQGRYVARIIRRRLKKEERPPFKYLDKGTMATIGKTKAVGMFGKIKFSGFFAWLAWCFVHIFFLIGFRNRILVLTQWLFSYFTPKRSSRLIYQSIDEKIVSKKKSLK